jgi:LysR family transcriptional regulator, hydrogen peroxide-inducible genes activator
MEMHQLRYFVKAAELGNFTRAAEQCFVSQPSLSQQIAKLEQELGQPVFERLGRKVVLTDAGRVLLEHAQNILSQADEAKNRIADQKQDGVGRVSIAAIPTIAPYLLPPVLKQYARQCPNATVLIHEEVTEKAVKMCLDGEADIILLALPLEEPQLHVEPLLRDELLLGLPRGHALAGRRRVALSDLAEEPFILLGEAHCLTDDVLAFCRQRDFRPRVTCRGSQLYTVQQLIALGHGISLIPRLAVEADRSRDRVYVPIAGRPSRTVVMAWSRHRYQSRLVHQFLETVRTVAAGRRHA